MGDAEPGSGSGLLVGDQLILTNNHVIPPDGKFKNVTVSVRLKSRLLSPLLVIHVQRDVDRDLALLTRSKPLNAASREACPMPVISSATMAPVGTAIYVVGFPLNEDLGITGGLISSHSSAAGRWRTDNLITYQARAC